MSERPQLPSDEEIRSKLLKIKEDAITQNGAGDELELELQAESLVANISAVTKAPVPSPEFDDLDAKLLSLKERATTAKAKHDKATKLDPKEIASSSSNARASGLGLMVAYMIMGFPFAGAGIGWLVDRFSGTKAYTGIGLMLGFVVGLAVTVGMVNKNAKNF